MPPVKPGCQSDDRLSYMEFIYPTDVVKIFIPRALDGAAGQAIFELAHRNLNATVYWHLDEDYLGVTNGPHQMPVSPKEGWHTITVVDNEGRTLTKRFEVFSK